MVLLLSVLDYLCMDLKHHHLAAVIYTLGNCVTDISPLNMCELNSTALECVGDTLGAQDCLCDEDFSGKRPCHLPGS